MTIREIAPEETLVTMREQLRRLEYQADALRSGLDEIAILLAWITDHSVASDALKRVIVTETELEQYRAMLTERYSDAVLRLVIKAQKATSQFKRSLPRQECQLAIRSLRAAFAAAAQSENLTIPDELEAVIGD